MKITVSSPMPPGIERRGHPRLALELPCHLHPVSAGTGQLAGRTLNISRNGVLLVLDRARTSGQLPAVGDRVRLDLDLPTHRLLRCHGRVARVEAGGKQAPRVALSVARMEFCDKRRKPAAAAGGSEWNHVRNWLV